MLCRQGVPGLNDRVPRAVTSRPKSEQQKCHMFLWSTPIFAGRHTDANWRLFHSIGPAQYPFGSKGGGSAKH
jgi:hypothetical protein